MSHTAPAPIDVRHLGRPGVICCWRVGDALIDPGPASSLPTLLEALGDWRPRRLLLTHIHLDHAGGAGTLVRRWPDLEVFVHERGARHMVDPSKLLASATRLYGDEMDRLWGEIAPIPEENLRIVTGGEEFDDWRVAATPGHASHHVAYHHGGSDWAFCGDVAGVRLHPTELVLPPTPPPDIDLDAWRTSIDLVEAWEPAALGLTHFGRADGVRDHFARLRAGLAAWGELSRDLDAERYEAAVRAALASALPAEQAAAFAQAMPPDHLWPGLQRYWERRAAADAS